jgi:hypothetical protein
LFSVRPTSGEHVREIIVFVPCPQTCVIYTVVCMPCLAAGRNQSERVQPFAVHRNRMAVCVWTPELPRGQEFTKQSTEHGLLLCFVRYQGYPFARIISEFAFLSITTSSLIFYLQSFLLRGFFYENLHFLGSNSEKVPVVLNSTTNSLRLLNQRQWYAGSLSLQYELFARVFNVFG